MLLTGKLEALWRILLEIVAVQRAPVRFDDWKTISV